MLTVVVAKDGQPREGVSLLDEIVRAGARRMLAAALEAEVDAYLADLAQSMTAGWWCVTVVPPRGR